MGNPTDVSPNQSSISIYFERIADALGCSTEDLILDSRTLKQSGQVELLRVWSLLPDDHARMQLLELARTLAATSGRTANGSAPLQAGSLPSGE